MKYTFEICSLTPTTSKLTVIKGITSELGAPVSRLVRIYCRSNGALIKTIRSDVQGRFKAYLPNLIQFTLVSIDPKRNFNAVIQDNVVPK